ncbi:MAG: phage holin family protein [Sphingomonadaceae bacterium]
MATRPEQPDSVFTTARQVAADTTTLLRTEAELARLETRSNVRAALGIGARLGMGAGLIGLALLFLLLAGLVALAQAFGWLPALLAVAGLCLLLGFLLLGAARRGADALSLLPERTLARVGGDLRAVADAIAPQRRHGQEEEQHDTHGRT